LPRVPGVEMKTMFALGLPSTSAPWGFHHSLGVSIKDVEGWWKDSLPTLKQDLENAATNLPGQQTPAPAPPPQVPQTVRSSGGPDGTTILVAVLLLGGAAGGYYFWKKSKEKGGKAAKAK